MPDRLILVDNLDPQGKLMSTLTKISGSQPNLFQDIEIYEKLIHDPQENHR